MHTVLSEGAPAHYGLSDDLARLCLVPQSQDSQPTLAWVVSICALFVLVGLVGLKTPEILVQPLSAAQESIPLLFMSEETPQQATSQSETAGTDSTPPEPVVPQIVRPVPVGKGSAFPVPMEGTNILVVDAVPFATAPPVKETPRRISHPTVFSPQVGSGEGSFPPPDYPATAMRNGAQGVAVIEMRVDSNGNVVSAQVFKSSGYTLLDEAALRTVQRRWAFTPGRERWLHWSCRFELR